METGQPEDAGQGDRQGAGQVPKVVITTKFENLLIPIEQRLRHKLDEARAPRPESPDPR